MEILFLPMLRAFQLMFLSYNAFIITFFSSYGFLNHFRPEPRMPNQVYRLDPVTRRVRVVATDFNKCNGIALSEDGKLAYMYVFLSNPSHLGLHRRCQPLEQILLLSVDF